MAKIRKFSSMETKCNESRPKDAYNQNIKLFQFLLSEYGSLAFILDIAESTLDFLARVFKKNKRLQVIINLLKYGIPAVVIVSEFISKIKRYRLIKSGKNNVTSEDDQKIRQVLGLKESGIELSSQGFMLGVEISRWLLQRPKTNTFKILGYYQYDTLTALTDVYKEDDTTIITVFETEGVKFALLIRLYRTEDQDIYVRVSEIYYKAMELTKVEKLKGKIYREFIQHFNIAENVILFSITGLQTFPRQEIVENPKYFDVKSFSEGIRKTLRRKKKRGFAFVGLPGTGKSTIIHCLESEIKEYPIVYLSTNCFSNSGYVRETFNTLRYIQPCIAIVEDLDSCDLKDKRQALGEFLEQVDDVDNSLQIVLLVSVNDTSLVHYSLINRPGRLDEVIMIKTPQDIDEIYLIMKCRYDKNRRKDTEIQEDFISFDAIDKDLLNAVLAGGYTQADVCEIVEKALLLDNEVTNQVLKESFSYLKQSKEALKKCNFGGDDPYKNYGVDAEASEPKEMSWKFK